MTAPLITRENAARIDVESRAFAAVFLDALKNSLHDVAQPLDTLLGYGLYPPDDR